MANRSQSWSNLREQICLFLIGPHALAFFPAGVLAAYWIGGEIALIAVSATLPLLFLALGGFVYITQLRNKNALSGRVGSNEDNTVKPINLWFLGPDHIHYRQRDGSGKFDVLLDSSL